MLSGTSRGNFARSRDSHGFMLPLPGLVRWLRRLCYFYLAVHLVVAVIRPAGDEVELEEPVQHAANRARRRVGIGGDARKLSETFSSSSAASSSSSSHAGCSGPSAFVDASDHADGHGHQTATTVAFVTLCLVVSSCLDYVGLSYPKYWCVPYSLSLYIVGMLVGLFVFSSWLEPSKTGFELLLIGIRDMSYVDPHALLYIFLPPLLYESASAMDWHVLKKSMSSAALLAIPGVLVNICFTGLLVRLILGPALDWGPAFLLASILAATDPVAVVAALQSLGAPPKLATLIEGESLLNDGSAFVFFQVFRDLSLKHAPDSEKMCPKSSLGCIVLGFFRLSAGAVAFGMLVSGITRILVKKARHTESAALEVGILLLAIYATFAVAEAIGVSGVLAVVTLGACVAADIMSHLSHHGRHVHHAFFHQVSYFCNQCLFFIAGIVSYRFMFFDAKGSWLHLCLLYIGIHLTRAAVVIVFLPALKRWGYGITWKEASVVVWGGLRGAVGLAMGLLVERNSYIECSVAGVIAFHTSGIVMLTLAINGPSVNSVYRGLNLYAVNPFRQSHIRRVMANVEQEFEMAIRATSDNWFFHDADWDQIEQCVPDLRELEFNLAGKPEFAHKEHVGHSLEHLTQTANQVGLNQMGKRKSMTQSFKERWYKRRDINSMKDLLNGNQKTSPQRLIPARLTSRLFGGTPKTPHVSQHSGSEERANSKRSSGMDEVVPAAWPSEGSVASSKSRSSKLSKPSVATSNDSMFAVTCAAGPESVEKRLSRLSAVSSARRKSQSQGPMTAGKQQSIGKQQSLGGRRVSFTKQPSYGKTMSVNKKRAEIGDCVLDHGGYHSLSSGHPWEQDLGRDQVLRMATSGAQVLTYQGTMEDERNCLPGVYVSRRPLTAFEQHSFHVKLVEVPLGYSAVPSDLFVGFYIDHEGVRSAEGEEGDGCQPLGLAPMSVAFDCATGCIMWTLGNGFDSQRALQTVGRGERVHVAASPRVDGSCQVTFTKVDALQHNVILGTVHLGFVTPRELFPVVELRFPPPPDPDSPHSSDRDSHSPTRDRVSTFSHSTTNPSLCADEPTSPTSPNRRGSAQSSQQFNNLGSSKGFMTLDRSSLKSSTSEMTTLTTTGSAGVTGWLRQAYDGVASSVSCNRLDLIAAPAPKAKQSVELSFEPKFASDSESLNMIFQVLFNAVIRQYTLMHELGDLSGDSFLRLKDAVGHAEDASNHEVGAKRAEGMLQTADRASFTESLSTESFSTLVQNRVEGLQKALTAMTPLREQSKSLQFEPLVVEYLIIERFCATDSVFDRSSIRLIRRLGYWRMKVKIESLWAFVETHTKIADEMAKNKMEVFQSVTTKLHEIVLKAQEDMGFLEDIHPRRFFYIKNFIALRMMFTIKLSKLEQVVNQGWVTESDVERLKHELQHRLAEMESFFPNINTDVVAATPFMSEDNSSSFGSEKQTCEVEEFKTSNNGQACHPDQLAPVNECDAVAQDGSGKYASPVALGNRKSNMQGCARGSTGRLSPVPTCDGSESSPYQSRGYQSFGDGIAAPISE